MCENKSEKPYGVIKKFVRCKLYCPRRVLLAACVGLLLFLFGYICTSKLTESDWTLASKLGSTCIKQRTRLATTRCLDYISALYMFSTLEKNRKIKIKRNKTKKLMLCNFYLYLFYLDYDSESYS